MYKEIDNLMLGETWYKTGKLTYSWDGDKELTVKFDKKNKSVDVGDIPLSKDDIAIIYRAMQMLGFYDD